jgi:hypothetical protein
MDHLGDVYFHHLHCLYIFQQDYHNLSNVNTKKEGTIITFDRISIFSRYHMMVISTICYYLICVYPTLKFDVERQDLFLYFLSKFDLLVLLAYLYLPQDPYYVF